MAVTYLEARLLQALNDQVEGWADVEGEYGDDFVWAACADRYAEAALEEVDA